MKNLEKIVFLEMTNKQLSKFPNKEYYETIKSLTENEDDEFTILSNQIHNIYNYINSKMHSFQIEDIEDYNEKIEPVNPIILKVASDFGITMKSGISEELKKSILEILGKDYLDEFLGKI